MRVFLPISASLRLWAGRLNSLDNKNDDYYVFTSTCRLSFKPPWEIHTAKSKSSSLTTCSDVGWQTPTVPELSFLTPYAVVLRLWRLHPCKFYSFSVSSLSVIYPLYWALSNVAGCSSKKADTSPLLPVHRSIRKQLILVFRPCTRISGPSLWKSDHVCVRVPSTLQIFHIYTQLVAKVQVGRMFQGFKLTFSLTGQ